MPPRRLAAGAGSLRARGHGHAAVGTAGRDGLALVPPAHRVRRGEPVGLRPHRCLSGLAAAEADARAALGHLPGAGASAMSAVTTAARPAAPSAPGVEGARVGPLGRLGRYTATHFRIVASLWLAVALMLGFFAPKVETALSGAGWEASGSQSVQARKL